MPPPELGPPAPAQRWPACDADVRAWIDAVAGILARHLEPELSGIYLHGSLATGCFRRPKSDVDLLVIVRERPDSPRLRELADDLATASSSSPTDGGLEIRIVRDCDLRPFPHGGPEYLAFSATRGEWTRRGPRIAIGGLPHLEFATVAAAARQRGVALHGPPPAQGIAPVPWAAYVVSVMDDLAWIVDGDHILRAPIYGVLNLCRTLAVLTAGEGCTLVDKEEGARRALSAFPAEHHPLVTRALAAYVSGDPVAPEQRGTGGLEWPPGPLLAFRDFAAAHAEDLGFAPLPGASGAALR